jgi:hypothetical protein
LKGEHPGVYRNQKAGPPLMQNKKIIFVNPKKRNSISNTDRDEVTAVTINTFLFLQRLSRIDLISERNSFKGIAKKKPHF